MEAPFRGRTEERVPERAEFGLLQPHIAPYFNSTFFLYCDSLPNEPNVLRGSLRQPA